MVNPELTFTPVGDCGVLAVCGASIDEAVNARVMALDRAVRTAALPGVTETVPTYAALLIRYDPLRTDPDALTAALRRLAASLRRGRGGPGAGRLVEIPVCYGGDCGPDLPFVAAHAGLREQEVVALHSGREYRIYMLGCLPGLPYLGGLAPRLYCPRLETPRTRIPAGSVGIGGQQTGIYPLDSPGGWRLIGRTPLTLFDPARGGRLPYAAGDRIRFVPISPSEFARLQKEEQP
ncbi:MAG: 5-oxoprolinase subunit PxpB [Gemmiger sp.]